jgi:hypothetical protein
MTAEDQAALYQTLADFIRDDFSGLERVFQLIQNRYGAAYGH